MKYIGNEGNNNQNDKEGKNSGDNQQSECRAHNGIATIIIALFR